MNPKSKVLMFIEALPSETAALKFKISICVKCYMGPF